MHHTRQLFVYKLVLIAGIILVIAAIGLTGNAFAGTAPVAAQAEGGFEQAQTTQTPPEQPAIDHSSFPNLQGPFEVPQDVTKACLSCHSTVAADLMNTVHWTWEYTNEETGQVLGKKNVINNFCISIQSNEPRCTSCHIGYGYADKDFDFTNEENIDCLVCHDTTGEYQKFPTAAGYPTTTEQEFPAGSGIVFSPPDLAKIAQNIGKTSRQTCGSCHFYGGGGDYVKHGDLDSSLIDPPYELDVHMSADGANFTCTTCHMTENHQISGSRYGKAPGDWQGCENCHTLTPHNVDSLNSHTDKLACQACHIPAFARGGLPTKLTWDWSAAGQLNVSGQALVTTNEEGLVIYDGKKGAFTYGYDVIPDYVWYNGNVSFSLPGDVIDPTAPVMINQFLGGQDDPNAKIYPVKTFTAIQPYDSGNNTLVIPHLFGSDPAAYWKTYDWGTAITAGMEYAGLPYSGQYDFVETVMLWPTTHMVAPASEALECHQCHTTENGRIDFAALGFSAEDVTKLTHFPPGTNFVEDAPTMTLGPETCEACHQMEYDLWTESSHAPKDVACVACHQLEEEGQHPMVAFTMIKGAEVCGDCHINDYRDWETSIHSQYNVTCVTCHNPHSQQQMTIGDYEISCETCHKDTADEIQHSTHTAVGMNCNECHMNTAVDTGHTWQVRSDTCLNCHAENIHTASTIVTNGDKPDAATETGQEAAQDSQQSVGISLPIWAGLFFAIVLGFGLTILFGRQGDNGKSEVNDHADSEE